MLRSVFTRKRSVSSARPSKSRRQRLNAIEQLEVRSMLAAVQWTLASGGNGHWYEVMPQSMTWDQAKSQAESRGGYLATVTSTSEQAFVQTLTNGSAWIGGYQDTTSIAYSEPAGAWKWVTGEPFTYTNWHLPGEPSNTGSSEHHLQIYGTSFQQKWNDLPGSQQLPAVFEFTAKPGVDYSGQNLSGKDFAWQDFTGANFTGTNLTSANLRDTSLRNANFTNANLSSAGLTGADLTGATLTGATLSNARFNSGTKWPAGFNPLNKGMWGPGVDYSGQNLSGKDFAWQDFTGANFTGTNLTSANLRDTSLRNANFTNANLSSAGLTGADLTGATLTGATLSNARFNTGTIWPAGFNPLNKGMWGPGVDYSGQDLSGKDLGYCDFTGANFANVVMRSGSLRGATLRMANVVGANLSGVDLTGVDLAMCRYNATTIWPVGFNPLAAGAAPVALLAEGLLAQYPLNGSADDVSGQARHGLAVNTTPAPDRNGRAGSAASFNGTSSKITVPHDASLNSLPFTASAWFLSRSTPSNATNRGILGKYVATGWNGYQMSFDSEGRIWPWYIRAYGQDVIGNYDAPGQVNPPFKTSPLSDGKWHHIVFVVDQTGGRYYVDGAFGGSHDWRGTPAAVTTSAPLVIGYYQQPTGGYFDGVIDDVRIFNRALSATDALRLYQDDGTPAASSISVIDRATLPENAKSILNVGRLSLEAAEAVRFELVPGPGDVDNGQFIVIGDQLRLITAQDYEVKTTLATRIRATDASGRIVESQVTIDVANVNETPADILLSAATLAENAGANAVVGTLSTTDPDSSNTFTYTLVAGTGSTDNAAFNISGNQLRASASLNFEAKSSYSVRVRSTDQGGLSMEKQFTVTVTNLNEAPTDIALSATSIAENAGANAVIGTLSTTDPDASNTFTYTLVTGSGSTDNAAFNISGNQLRATASLNFELRTSYSVRIRSTDQVGLFTEKAFTILVTNVNETPTNIVLSAETIAENLPSGTTVGTLSTTDADAGDTFTYSLIAGAGSTDNASFTTTGNTLKTAASFNFEAKSSYSIRVRSTDAVGLSTEKQFTITVTNVNEPPTDIALSAATIAENAGTNAVVGTLSTTDPESGNTFTYSLVSGAGSTDNATFNVAGNQLRATASLNFEAKNSYSVRVRSTDQGGLFTEKAFTITATNVNEAPTDIALSATSIAENAGVNAVVGTLSTTDPDADNTFTYTLVAGTGSTDNTAFNILGNQLRATASLDFEAKSSYSLRVRSTDQGGLFTEKAFTIAITDTSDLPPDIQNGLVARYRFDANALDSSGNGRDGVIKDATPAVDRFGFASGALSFNGSSSWVRVPHAAALNSFPITVSAWFRSTADSPGYIVAKYENATWNGWGLSVEKSRVQPNSASGYYLASRTNALISQYDDYPPFEAGQNLNDGTWHHVSMVVDQASGRLYLDGTLADTQAWRGTPSAATASWPMYFGYYPNSLAGNPGVNPYFSGSIDDVRIYSRALTGQEVQLLYASESVPNQAPTDIGLSTLSIAENAETNAVVGTLTTADPDAGDTFTYSLVAGPGSTDNASFTISGNTLKTAASFNYEAKSSYSIRVKSTDAGGFSTEKQFTVSVTNVNETPTDIILSATMIAENAGANAVVGTFFTTDLDSSNTFTYTLVAGTGSTDNAAFNIAGNQLRATASLNFEAKSSYSVRVRGTDQGGLFIEKQFTIAVTDVNEAPHGVVLYRSSLSVPESLRPTVALPLAAVTVIDDVIGTYSLSLQGSDAMHFALSDGQLWLKPGIDFDYGVKSQYTVTVSARDASLPGIAPVTASFVLEITNDPDYHGREYADVGGGQTKTDSTSRSGTRALIKRGEGTLILSASSRHSGGTTIEAGEVIVRNSAALGSGRLTVKSGATVTLDLHDSTMRLGSLSVEPGARLDVGYGKFTLPAGSYTISTIRQLALGGFWTGVTGLVSRSASVVPGGNVGYIVNDDGSITVGFAANGDTNLDGSVDLLDISTFSSSGKLDTSIESGWVDGDFNYDNVVDILDATSFIASGLVDGGPYVPVPAPGAPAPLAAASTSTLSAIEAAFLSLAADAGSEGTSPAGKKPRFSRT
jgi:autotransporter-associated beta strand protein